jgi:hypothetical protein
VTCRPKAQPAHRLVRPGDDDDRSVAHPIVSSSSLSKLKAVARADTTASRRYVTVGAEHGWAVISGRERLAGRVLGRRCQATAVLSRLAERAACAISSATAPGCET